jgi:hypothetical protein
MSETGRYAAPTANLAKPPEISADQLRQAHKALNWSRLGFVVFFVGFVSMGYVRPLWAPLLLLAMYGALILAHVFLGLAAVRSGRGWVLYSLLPVLAPVLGGLISFGVLRSKVPYADA